MTQLSLQNPGEESGKQLWLLARALGTLNQFWPKGTASGGWTGGKPVRAEGPRCWEEADSGQNGIS